MKVELQTWTWPVEVPINILSEPEAIAVMSVPSKSGREGVLSTSSGALTGVTVKKLKDFHEVNAMAGVYDGREIGRAHV